MGCETCRYLSYAHIGLALPFICHTEDVMLISGVELDHMMLLQLFAKLMTLAKNS
jgi:hypothetical protein